MQFSTITGLKPLVLSAFVAGTAFNFAYNDIDMSSHVNSEISNPNTSNYFSNANSDIYSNIALKQIFEDYYQKWERKTRIYSFSNQIIEEENFKKIIAMGKKATPFIIEKLNEEPSPLVWALNLIYNKKISNNPNTTIEQACKLWVESLS